MAHLWTQYARPLLHALRCVQACATDRIRVLYNSFHFLQRQRAQAAEAVAQAAAQTSGGGGLGFGLLRSTPTPPPASVAQQQAALAAQQAPLPLSDYIVYMQEFAHVRMQALLLLKQLLLSDEFAQAVGECIVQVNEQVSLLPQAPPNLPTPCSASGAPPPSTPPRHAHHTSLSAASSSSPGATSVSALLSWTSSCFWQLCLDEVLFPLLSDLSSSAAQPLFLESSVAFGLVRAQAVSLLSKVFLRTLPALLRHGQTTTTTTTATGSSPINNASFTRTWLNVLKTFDRYMQLGVHLQRQQTAAMQHANGVVTAASTTSAAGARSTAGPTGVSAAGVPLALLPVSGVSWSAESGLQLTESVAEALKNVVLVMKAQGVFDEAPFHAPQTATSTTPTAAAAVASTAPRSQQPHGLPTGELWQLTVGMLTPWLPFIPALQSEIMPPVEAQPEPPQPAQAQEQQPLVASTQPVDATATAVGTTAPSLDGTAQAASEATSIAASAAASPSAAQLTAAPQLQIAEGQAI
jgi:hypothetical protein